VTNRPDIEQSGIRCRVNEYIDVTTFRVIATSNRTEYTGVARSMRLHDAPNRLAVNA
jgi:hypothetical protein